MNSFKCPALSGPLFTIEISLVPIYMTEVMITQLSQAEGKTISLSYQEIRLYPFMHCSYPCRERCGSICYLKEILGRPSYVVPCDRIVARTNTILRRRFDSFD